MFAILSGRSRAVIIGTLAALSLFILLQCQNLESVNRLSSWRPMRAPVANATLGFGAIIAKSVEDHDDPKSWRQRGLIAAANRTGIEIRIPPPIPMNQTALDILTTVGDGPYPKPGSARAFYTHIMRLEEFLASGMETMFLLEDDVDWEVDIRRMLAPSADIATGIRSVTGSQDDPQVYPYGREWELLWLGHCGFQSRKGDRTLVVHNQDTISTRWMKSIFGSDVHQDMDVNTRVIHTRAAAMCSFGIVVTRPWARQFVENAYKGGTKGADYSTHLQCGREDMRCIALRPEIMHQQKAIGGGYTSDIEKINQQAAAASQTDAAPAAKAKEDEVHFFTFNVKYSARCNVGRPDNDRATCPPTAEDWKNYDA